MFPIAKYIRRACLSFFANTMSFSFDGMRQLGCGARHLPVQSLVGLTGTGATYTRAIIIDLADVSQKFSYFSGRMIYLL